MCSIHGMEYPWGPESSPVQPVQSFPCTSELRHVSRCRQKDGFVVFVSLWCSSCRKSRQQQGKEEKLFLEDFYFLTNQQSNKAVAVSGCLWNFDDDSKDTPSSSSISDVVLRPQCPEPRIFDHHTTDIEMNGMAFPHSASSFGRTVRGLGTMMLVAGSVFAVRLLVVQKTKWAVGCILL